MQQRGACTHVGPKIDLCPSPQGDSAPNMRLRVGWASQPSMDPKPFLASAKRAFQPHSGIERLVRRPLERRSWGESFQLARSSSPSPPSHVIHPIGDWRPFSKQRTPSTQPNQSRVPYSLVSQNSIAPTGETCHPAAQGTSHIVVRSGVLYPVRTIHVFGSAKSKLTRMNMLRRASSYPKLSQAKKRPMGYLEASCLWGGEGEGRGQEGRVE